jgi:hypothetical protein
MNVNEIEISVSVRELVRLKARVQQGVIIIGAVQILLQF